MPKTAVATPDGRPTHLIALPGDIKAMCGIDIRTSAGCPFMWVPHVDERRKSYAAHGLELILCPECELAAVRPGIVERIARLDAEIARREAM